MRRANELGFTVTPLHATDERTARNFMVNATKASRPRQTLCLYGYARDGFHCTHDDRDVVDSADS